MAAFKRRIFLFEFNDKGFKKRAYGIYDGFFFFKGVVEFFGYFERAWPWRFPVWILVEHHESRKALMMCRVH